MALHRPLPSRKCIEGKGCALVGSTYWYNDLIFLTSSIALRVAMPVIAALEVAL